MTRARLLGAGLPAPFERDPRNPLDRRARGRRVDPADPPTAADPDSAAAARDNLADAELDETPPDEA